MTKIKLLKNVKYGVERKKKGQELTVSDVEAALLKEKGVASILGVIQDETDKDGDKYTESSLRKLKKLEQEDILLELELDPEEFSNENERIDAILGAFEE